MPGPLLAAVILLDAAPMPLRPPGNRIVALSDRSIERAAIRGALSDWPRPQRARPTIRLSNTPQA